MRHLFTLFFILLLINIGCSQGQKSEKKGQDRKIERMEMVEEQIIARGIEDPDVIEAMKKVPRDRFVPPEYKEKAYRDHPLPIGEEQTISQPYVVALMSEQLELSGKEKVLEIGTGSGYQAAILGELAQEVHSIEIRESLVKKAKEALKATGHENVKVHHGDGYKGLPEEAPFDGIIVTAAPEKVPEALKEQLAIGGRMVLPVGDRVQELMVLIKEEEGQFKEKKISNVQFVPMIRDSSDKK